MKEPKALAHVVGARVQNNHPTWLPTACTIFEATVHNALLQGVPTQQYYFMKNVLALMRILSNIFTTENVTSEEHCQVFLHQLACLLLSRVNSND